MTDAVKQMLAKAEQREIKARLADDRRAAALYLDLADQWRELAQQVQSIDTSPRRSTSK